MPSETKGQRENPENKNSKDENIENEKLEDTDNHVSKDEESDKHVDIFEERPPILDGIFRNEDIGKCDKLLAFCLFYKPLVWYPGGVLLFPDLDDGLPITVPLTGVHGLGDPLPLPPPTLPRAVWGERLAETSRYGSAVLRFSAVCITKVSNFMVISGKETSVEIAMLQTQ